ncbi:hypothetical protein EPN87_03585 [archaeon]|nr:MAG: hypothetical protein EPN87_03585 [archaeon]
MCAGYTKLDEKFTRTDLQRAVDIMAAAIGGQGPTQIMYRARLEWKKTASTLESLVKDGMLKPETTDGAMKYYTTPLGLRFLDDYDKLILRLPTTLKNDISYFEKTKERMNSVNNPNF